LAINLIVRTSSALGADKAVFEKGDLRRWAVARTARVNLWAAF